MRPTLIARNEYGTIYIRVVHLDYVLRDITRPSISVQHQLTHNYHTDVLVPAAYIPEYLSGGWAMLKGVSGDVRITPYIITPLMCECRDKCHSVGMAWTIIEGVDGLLWRLIEAINNDLFFRTYEKN